MVEEFMTAQMSDALAMRSLHGVRKWTRTATACKKKKCFSSQHTTFFHIIEPGRSKTDAGARGKGTVRIIYSTCCDSG